VEGGGACLPLLCTVLVLSYLCLYVCSQVVCRCEWVVVGRGRRRTACIGCDVGEGGCLVHLAVMEVERRKVMVTDVGGGSSSVTCPMHECVMFWLPLQ